MIKVDLVEAKGRTHVALVCTFCGRIYSKDRAFKGELKLKAV